MPDEAPPAAFANGPAAEALLAFVGEDGALERWMLIGGGDIMEQGENGDLPPVRPPVRAALAVPGTQVAIHWLDLPDALSLAQAAAAARLKLADSIAQPLAELHVAAGGRDGGLTAVAAVPMGRMADWLATSAARGFDPQLIVPAPMLLPVPAEGLARCDRDAVADYRGAAQAFSLEPGLAPYVIGDKPVETVDERAFAAGLGAALADPALNLRQGPFARRRRVKVEWRQVRRLAMLALALLLATFAAQVATILRYTFAADELEAEAAEISRAAGGGARLGALRGAGAGYQATASAVFAAVQATPNVEMTEMNYMPDGTLRTTIQADGSASIGAFYERIEAAGYAVEAGEVRSGGGRPTVEMIVRPL